MGDRREPGSSPAAGAPPRFIVIEGVDGAGTTTQCARLVRRLEDDGAVAHGTREPSDGPIGQLLRRLLRGDTAPVDPPTPTAPTESGERGPGPAGGDPDWRTMALLFAADRRDHLHREVLPALRRGSWVVSDRYVHSSVAYQSVAGTGDREAVVWVRSLNQGVRVPDLTVVLEVPAAVAAGRRAARGGPRELYEADGLQRRLVDFYRRIDDHFPGEPIVHVDGDRPLDEVAEDVFAAVAPLVVPAGPDPLSTSTP